MGRGAVKPSTHPRKPDKTPNRWETWWAVLDSNQINNDFNPFQTSASLWIIASEALISKRRSVSFLFIGQHTNAGQTLPRRCPEGLWVTGKIKLTDRKLKALKPAKTGQRDEIMDAEVNGFGVRITDKGKLTFILTARYPGSNNPTRRALGEYPTDTLAESRERARQWRKLIERGIDPKDEEERQRLAELRKRADTFDSAVAVYSKRVLAKQRRGHIVAKEIEKEFSEKWRGRPITSITRADVLEVINDALDRGAPYQARNLLGNMRAMFNWAIEAGSYGLETSPCDRIRPKHLIGERVPRDRVLTDDEIRALWSSSERIGYPFGPLIQLLMLTGVRKSEASGAQWSELNLKGRLWTVPAERFKSKSTHLVPLTDDTITLLETLPSFNQGDHLFSTSLGKSPVTGFAKAKLRLDRLMQEELGKKPTPFRLHDIRRTVRTRLAGLRIADEVAEMIIGHGRKGIQRVYDQHTYEAEMREALDLWAARLRDIVTPAPGNVVRLKKESA
jgi:integrase